MPSYAQIADLYAKGAPPESFKVGGVPIDPVVLQGECDTASSTADGSIGPRGQLPLLTPYPPELVEAVCKIAAYNILSVRGLSPTAGADSNMRLRYEDAMRWLNDVRTQRVSPAFVFSPDVSLTHQQPMVLSQSKNPTTGRWAPNRGW